jgi:undecaprenyl diphosphate synthase
MNTPTTIGIIMDGNRRWAKEQGLSTLKGHIAGKDKLKEVVGWAKEEGVKNLLLYAFSTENWNRTEEELSSLFEIFENALDKEMRELAKQNIRIRFIGQVERFSKSVQIKMKDLEKETRNNTAITVGICLSYGGRQEIINAVNRVITSVITPVITTEKPGIDEEMLGRFLWTAGMPDPDIIIRTGGEKRLSNFLPWQSVYSELYFSDTYWPAFSKEEFKDILNWYSERNRRYGE